MNLFWKNSGLPASKFRLEPATGYCATCGDNLTQGVRNETLAGDAFSRQSEFLAHGSHVCEACAWMYSSPKDTHRNVIAVGDKIWWPMIGHDSATDDRPTWYQVLTEVATMPPNTPCIGVLTTDPKPRLWPMTQQRTLGDFGLYVHCPDYDISEFRTFDLNECLATCRLIIECLSLGFSKQACWHGLFSDLKKVNKIGVDKVVALEAQLREARLTPHFLSSLLVAGIKKTEKVLTTESTTVKETVTLAKPEPIPEVTLDTTRTSRLFSAQQATLF